MEYQVRLDEDARSLNSHFAELLGHKQVTEDLELNAGYRFTIRPDHDEHRLYLGGFWDVRSYRKRSSYDHPHRFKLLLQLGYQYDFDVKSDDRLIDSQSLRYVLTVAKPVSKKVTPFLLGGVLTTWNSTHDFGVDKIRLGGGLALKLSEESLIRFTYMQEENRFADPSKRTNIFWVRYEMRW